MAIKLEPILQEFKVDNKLALAGIGAVTAALAAVATTAVLAVKGTFDWANELDGIQDVMGVTAKEAAALNFVLRKSGTETDALTRGMVVLEKGLFKADGSLDTIGEKMQEFGINALDVNGRMKDQGTLIGEISNKYNSLGTQTERVNFLTELFGRSGAELIDVFDTLAKEGGLDKTTEKVEKMGLAIDPQKYEDFQRNLEEVKLAFLGMAITIVDTLMPELNGLVDWWNTDGLPMFQGMVKWLGTNVPVAVQGSKKAWEALSNYWKTNAIPVGNELSRGITNLNQVLKILDPELNIARILWDGLMTAMVPFINIYIGITGGLRVLAQALDLVNDILEAGISAWYRYTGAANTARAAASSVPSVPSASGGTTGGRSPGRATGGSVLANKSYTINERKQEVFIPSTNGTIGKGLEVAVKFTDGELDKLGRSIARYMKPAQQRFA